MTCLEELCTTQTEVPLASSAIVDGAAVVQMLHPKDARNFSQYASNVFISYINSSRFPSPIWLQCRVVKKSHIILQGSQLLLPFADLLQYLQHLFCKQFCVFKEFSTSSHPLVYLKYGCFTETTSPGGCPQK